jgi:uncharacterized FAD-dependent dehydrogenase
MPGRLPDEVTVVVGVDEPADAASLRARVARLVGVPPDDVPALTLRRRSLDARRGRVCFHLLLAVGAPPSGPLGEPAPREIDDPGRVLVVGDGPAGLFAAYELARHGVGATVLERGKPVRPRRLDLKGLTRGGVVDADSNYCFGEGGAGTYSDGKLYTRAHKRGNVRDVLEVLALHGAPPAILTEARPHIGSNRLPQVVSAIRARLEDVGVRFRFGARVAGLLSETARDGRRAAGVRLAGGEELPAEAVILATGHSARDVHAFLAAAGVPLEAKPFAVGVRAEHPQALVDRAQYGRFAGHPALPAAAYRLAHAVDGRGVFSFCMCPGGWVVPAATEPGELVVNGMSLSRRDSPFANAGLVVAVEAADVAAAGFTGPLGGVDLQRALERAAWEAGGGALRAPATRVTDFLAGRASTTVPRTSYVPGVVAGDVGAVLGAVALPLAGRLAEALVRFGRLLPGYVTEDAVLIAVESRTSSPVRVPRDPETLVARGLGRLWPAGEGAGHAGGIVSAAVDGIAVARRVVRALGG